MSDATDRLVVDINRDGARSLAVPGSVTVDRSFVVDLQNHGMATHVHLHLDDALSKVARLSNANHHVPSETTRRVRVEIVEPDDGDYAPVTGNLKIAIAYGQETRFIDLTVDLSSHEPVSVDPDLAEPRGGGAGRGATTTPGSSGAAPGAAGGSSPLARSRTLRLLPVVVLGLVAVVLAVAAVLPAGAPDLSLGGLAVAAAVLAAGYLLLS